MRNQASRFNPKSQVYGGRKIARGRSNIDSRLPAMCASRTTSFDRRSSLVRQASYVVSFVAADLASPAVGRLIAGMESHLWQRGHTLMISSREDLGNANGMVVIGDKKSLSTNVPATSIDLQGMVFEEH